MYPAELEIKDTIVNNQRPINSGQCAFCGGYSDQFVNSVLLYDTVSRLAITVCVVVILSNLKIETSTKMYT